MKIKFTLLITAYGLLALVAGIYIGRQAPTEKVVNLLCYNDKKNTWDRCRQSLKNADGKTVSVVAFPSVPLPCIITTEQSK